MGNFRQLVNKLLLSAIIVTSCALAQSNLTQIRDTIYNADGTPFNGTVVITWNGFVTGTGISISPLSTSARIYNGALSVLLVPSTTAAAGSYYQVVYHSSDGTVTWSETWSVPPSTNALSVSGVRTSTTSGSGSGSGGSNSGGGTQYATLPIAISQVTGLSSSLNTLTNTLTTLTSNLSSVTATTNTNAGAITTLNTSVSNLSGSVASLTATVNNLSSGAGNSGVAFIDGETPGGTIDGLNSAFSLLQAPTPANSLELYRNGIIQTAGIDYTLSGKVISFLPGSIPRPADLLQAYYRATGSGTLPTFVDGAIPTGSIDGQNLTFGVAVAPSPVASLRLYKNGVLLANGGDYTVHGAVITFSNGAAPQSGDALTVFYRH